MVSGINIIDIHQTHFKHVKIYPINHYPGARLLEKKLILRNFRSNGCLATILSNWPKPQLLIMDFLGILLKWKDKKD